MDIPAYLLFLSSFIWFIAGITASHYFEKHKRKYVGEIEVERDLGGIKRYSLVFNQDPELIDREKEVTFKIRPKKFLS